MKKVPYGGRYTGNFPPSRLPVFVRAFETNSFHPTQDDDDSCSDSERDDSCSDSEPYYENYGTPTPLLPLSLVSLTLSWVASSMDSSLSESESDTGGTPRLDNEDDHMEVDDTGQTQQHEDDNEFDNDYGYIFDDYVMEDGSGQQGECSMRWTDLAYDAQATIVSFLSPVQCLLLSRTCRQALVRWGYQTPMSEWRHPFAAAKVVRGKTKLAIVRNWMIFVTNGYRIGVEQFAHNMLNNADYECPADTMWNFADLSKHSYIWRYMGEEGYNLRECQCLAFEFNSTIWRPMIYDSSTKSFDMRVERDLLLGYISGGQSNKRYCLRLWNRVVSDYLDLLPGIPFEGVDVSFQAQQNFITLCRYAIRYDCKELLNGTLEETRESMFALHVEFSFNEVTREREKQLLIKPNLHVTKIYHYLVVASFLEGNYEWLKKINHKLGPKSSDGAKKYPRFRWNGLFSHFEETYHVLSIFHVCSHNPMSFYSLLEHDMVRLSIPILNLLWNTAVAYDDHQESTISADDRDCIYQQVWTPIVGKMLMAMNNVLFRQADPEIFAWFRQRQEESGLRLINEDLLRPFMKMTDNPRTHSPVHMTRRLVHWERVYTDVYRINNYSKVYSQLRTTSPKQEEKTMMYY